MTPIISGGSGRIMGSPVDESSAVVVVVEVVVELVSVSGGSSAVEPDVGSADVLPSASGAGSPQATTAERAQARAVVGSRPRAAGPKPTGDPGENGTISLAVRVMIR